MTDQTVPETPEGSVESYVEIMRRIARHIGFLDGVAFGFVQSIAGGSLLSDEERVARIRNVIAAAALLDREAER